MKPEPLAELMESLQALKESIDTSGVTFVPSVKEIRRELGRTQVSFARLLGVSVPTLRSWERGTKRPGPEVEARLERLWDEAVETMAGGELAEMQRHLVG